MNRKSEEKVENDKKLTLTPHTLRLLRLITTSSSITKSSKESTCQAISILAKIASRSHPIILWDILARLYTSLTSPDESDAVGGGIVRRDNIALAMEHVAKHIPVVDQQSFLIDNYENVTMSIDNENNKVGKSAATTIDERRKCRQWLEVHDFMIADSTNSNQTMLDLILEKGRLLLSCSESRFNVSSARSDSDDNSEYKREEGMLARLDGSVSTSETTGNESQSTLCMEKFTKERIRLQRSILAKRLGLGGILSSSIIEHYFTDSLSDIVTDKELQDMSPNKASSSASMRPSSNDQKSEGKRKISAREKNMERMKKRQKIEKIKERKRCHDADSAQARDENDSEDSTIRKILLLSLDHDKISQRQNTNSTKLLSHKTPQALLATDLIFHTFHPSWHIRHGSLLGLRSLLRSWRGSSPKSRSLRSGGIPIKEGADADLICVFGRWPQDILARCLCILALDRFGDYAGPSIGDKDNEWNVAPVREAAAQVISFLLEMAPLKEVQECFRVLQKMYSYKLHWEVRHGAILSLRYVSSLMVDSRNVSSFVTILNTEVWTIIPPLVVTGMHDESDDVKSVSAQAASCLMSFRSNSATEGEVIHQFAPEFIASLWSALRTVQVTSSCSLDLLQCLSDLVKYNCGLVLTSIRSSGGRSPMQELLTKLGDFIEFHSIAIRHHCFQTISIISEPLTSLVLQHSPHGANKNKTSNHDTVGSLVHVYCRLLTLLFESIFLDAYEIDGNEQNLESEANEISMVSIYQGKRMESWTALSKSVQQIVSTSYIHDETISRAIFETTLGLLLRYLNVWTQDDRARRWTYKIESKIDIQYSCQLAAAKAITILCAYTINRVKGIDELLGTVVTSMMKSPWFEHCELACVLVHCLSSVQGRRQHYNVLERCRSSLLELGEDLNPVCVLVGTIPKIDSIRKCRAVEDLCKKALESVLRKIYENTSDEKQSMASAILRIWSDVYKQYGVDLSIKTSSPSALSLASMRLRGAIGGATVSLGPGNLPKKLTPTIRSLVTMIKNEENYERSRVCGDFLASLIQLLQGSNVASKILTNVCNMASAPPESVQKGFTKRGSQQAKLIVQSIVAKMPIECNLQEIEPFWKRLGPLATSDPAKFSVKSLSEGLIFLCTVSSALNKRSKSLTDAISTFLPTVTVLACTCPIAKIRQDAVNAVRNFCSVDIELSIPIVLPFIKKFLEAVDDDPRRLGSCVLLNTIVCSQGVSLCPYIRYILPISMSSMADPVKKCADLSASSFSQLVRFAPLVQSESGDIDSVKLDVGQWGEGSSKKVIDHLILGKPLPPCRIPDKIKFCLEKSGITLRGYQIQGLSWLQFLKNVRLNGALCDDMGLGKTLQALLGITIAHEQARSLEKKSKPKSLVVCPSSVTGQWMNEVAKIGLEKGVITVFQYSGPMRKKLWKQSFMKSDIIITSYPILRSDICILEETCWTYCVLDEGHLLKNPNTKTAKAARRLHSHHRLILSGTPVQNKVHELWSVFDWLMPNYLGNNIEFRIKYAGTITRGNLPGASSKDIRDSMEKLKHLHQQVLPFILRREKEDVLEELPSKIITDIPCTMTALQRSAYNSHSKAKETQNALQLLERLTEENDELKIADTQSNGSVLKSLLSLRLICTHSSLVLEDKSDSTASFATSGKLLALNDLLRRAQIFHDEVTAADNDDSILYIDTENTEGSKVTVGEGDTVTDIFEEGTIGFTKHCHSKCLIFSQYTQSLDVIEDLIFKPLMPSLRYVRLDGRTAPQDRNVIVDSFQSDDTIKCMLLTSKVGSLGLNLQAADTVIFLESDWNPFVDIQAMDRSHRIGQNQNVKVYRLITKDSIEEKIMALQKIKLINANAIVNTDNSTLYSMGTDRLLDLFTTKDLE